MSRSSDASTPIVEGAFLRKQREAAKKLFAQGRYRQAIAILEAGLAAGESETCELAGAYADLAESWRNLGKYREAAACFEKRIQLLRQYHGAAAHPDLAVACFQAGSLWESLMRRRKALPYYESALAVMVQLGGTSDPNTCQLADKVADLRLHLRQQTERQDTE